MQTSSNNNRNNIFSTEQPLTSDDDDLVTDYLGNATTTGSSDHSSNIMAHPNSANSTSGRFPLQQRQPSQDMSTTGSNTTTPRSSRGSIHLFSSGNNTGTASSSSKSIPTATAAINNNNSSFINNSTSTHNHNNGGGHNMVPIISVTPHSPGTKFTILEDSLNQIQSIRETLMQMKSPTNQNFSALNTTMINSRLSSSCPSLADLMINGPVGNNSFWPNPMYTLNTDRRKSWTAIEDLTECTKNSNKSEIDLPEKRRKRGSLFFRKKKDKNKTKGQSTNCDVCGAVINLASYKEHAVECKAKLAKGQHGKSGSGKSKSSHGHANALHNEDTGRGDYYDGHNHNNEHISYSDDAPLIRGEFLYEPQIGPEDLGAEPILGIAMDEHDSWSPSVPKEVVKSLKDKQVKRQEHIYEFIMTEKHHCQTLLVMQKLFVDDIQKYFNGRVLDRMFPRLVELTDLHTGFLKKLRLKQHENYIVDSIADILLEFFSSASAQKLKSAYGEFCSNHRSALDAFKEYMTETRDFANWYKHCQSNALLKKKGIPECILFVTQRLTKYPLLIDPLLKSSRDDKVEQEKLQKAMAMVKEILVDVDAKVAEKEKELRRLSIYKKIDVKSFAMYKNIKFKKSDIIDTNRQLKFEGIATLMQGRSKMQTVTVVVMSDCLFFLQENSQKYSFFTPENKAGVVSLQKLLIREKAGTESRGIYIISSNPSYPEMYELKVQNPKDKNVWIQAIRAAVLEAPTDEQESEDHLTVEQKQRLIDERQANMRNIIYKLRRKDLEQAVLLEEKIHLMYDLWQESHTNNNHNHSSHGGNNNSNNNNSIMGGGSEVCVGPELDVENFIYNFGAYKDLINDDCDTMKIFKRVEWTIHEIIQLASNLYSAATGLPLSRSFSSVGEKQSELFISPTLPKRAETFGGFDERRSKSQNNANSNNNASNNNLPWRDAVLSTLPVTAMASNKDMMKRDSMTSDLEPSYCGSISPHQHQTMMVNSENISIKDHNMAALQVSDHLHTLLCIIMQQMTTIQSLQQQVKDQSSRNMMYKHNDQLEELRNLQDKLQEEKTVWLKEREQQEKELEEKRQQLKKLQEQIKTEQDDIKQQREQLYKKMEILSNQGLLLSPSVALPIPLQSQMDNIDSSGNNSSGILDDSQQEVPNEHRRKEKWRTQSISKTSSPHGVSNTSVASGKVQIRQQLPLKLSSLSSSSSGSGGSSAMGTRNEKSNSITSPMMTSPPGINAPSSSSRGGDGNSHNNSVTQMFPLKLADRKSTPSTVSASAAIPMTSYHSRTGSSPAVIQQNAYQSGNSAVRTNTYPKVPDRVRIRSTDGTGIQTPTLLTQQQHQVHMQHQQQQQQHQQMMANTAMGQKRIPTNSGAYSGVPQQQQQHHHHHHQGQHPPQQQQQQHHHHHHHHHNQTPPQPPPRHFEKDPSASAATTTTPAHASNTNKDEEVIYF